MNVAKKNGATEAKCTATSINNQTYIVHFANKTCICNSETFDSIRGDVSIYYVCTQRTERQKNYVASVRKIAIPTERPLLLGEVSTNFCG
jgi:hypothetical protein